MQALQTSQPMIPQVTGTTTYSERLDRYQKQRDEWLRNLLMILSPAVEQILRKIWQAADLCVQMKPNVVALDDAYLRLIAQMRTWSDAEMRNELGGEKKAEEADLLLQMVVKAHATVLALSSAVRCKQVIAVPAVVKFYRNVIETCSTELAQSDFFCTFDIDIRSKVRGWIDRIVAQQALGIVPVGLFARTTPEEQNPRIRALQRAIERVENDTDLPEMPIEADMAPTFALETPVLTAPLASTQDKPTAVSVPITEPAAPAPMTAAPEPVTPIVPVKAPAQQAQTEEPMRTRVTATQIAREADLEEEGGEHPLSISMNKTASPSGSRDSSPKHLPRSEDGDDELQSVMSDGEEPI